ncbi:MAG: triosephosphate isomerase [Pirellulaceae bacterium]|nr:MAG: triosephosphate isomerase [Pirellulaceae bacterium]
MNTLRASAVELASGIARAWGSDSLVEVAVCPPAVYLTDVVRAVEGSAVGVGAQNMHHESSGAFTGEVSGPMLVDVGCRYVILGHSERREYFHETDEVVNRKVMAAFTHGLTPIVCVGEKLEHREAGETAAIVEQQVRGSLANLEAEQARRLVIAYEPVWAIGTGKTATPAQAEEVHAQIRTLLGDLFGEQVAAEVRIQYGGSVKPENAGELLSQPNIDGALVGGASLSAESFIRIIEAATA